MLPTDVLLDMLKYLDRDGLANIQTTNCVINDIIKRDFASKPLRIFDENILPRISRNENGEMYLVNCRHDECYVTTIREWQNCKNYALCEKHSRPVDELRPFLSKYMRFKEVEICMNNTNDLKLPFCTPEQVTLLESIAHIWNGQMLSISILNDSDRNADSLKRLFGSSAILRCHSLWHYNRCLGNEVLTSALMENYQCPNLYTLHTIYFSWTDNILRLTRYKAAYPMSDTLFVFSKEYSETINMTLHAVETIKKEFLASSTPSRLRMIFEFIFYGENELAENMEFRLENGHTKEALQLKRITMQEAKEKFNVDLYKHSHELYRILAAWTHETTFEGFTDGVDGQAFFLERFAT